MRQINKFEIIRQLKTSYEQNSFWNYFYLYFLLSIIF